MSTCARPSPRPGFSASLPLLLLTVTTAAACSADGDDDNDINGDNVTLASLPADQRAAFEAWKAQPIKDCLGTQAFAELAREALEGRGVAPQPVPHVDLTALYAETHGSSLIEGLNGEIVLFGRPTDDDSTSRHELKTTYTVDGHTERSLALTAARDRGECVVTLGGEEVFRTRMAASIEVAAYVGAGDFAHRGTHLTPPVFDPTQTVGALDAAPLLAPVIAEMKPNSVAPAVLSARFDIDVRDGFHLFTGGPAQLPVTVRPQFADAPEVAPDAVMYGPAAALARFAGTSTTFGADLIFVPQLADVPTADPTKLIVLHVEAEVHMVFDFVHPTSITARPAIERSDAAALACFASRVQAARAFLTSTAPRLPGFEAMFASCRDLAVDGHGALLADPASQQRIASATFTGPLTHGTALLGWDLVFLQVVERLVAAGTDLATLDPTHANPALDTALARATTWRQAMPAAAPAELRATVIPTSLRWALDGVSILPDLDGLMPAVFANAAAVYPTSVRRMIDDVSAGAAAGLDAARCGAELAGARAARVAATLAGAATLPEAGQFTRHLTDRLLQICPEDSELDRVDAGVALARTFVAQDRARGTTAQFEGAANAIIEHAILEGWTADSYAALDDLIPLAVTRRPTCATNFTSHVERLLCLEARLDRFSIGRGKLLDPALTARHGAFARDFLPIRQGSLSGAAFAAVRSVIDAAFFDRGLWTGCTDQGFGAARAALFQSIDQLVVADPEDRPAIAAAIVAQVNATSCP